MMSPPLNAIQVKTTQTKAHLAADIARCCGKVAWYLRFVARSDELREVVPKRV
jgi:hypothetical protein